MDPAARHLLSAVAEEMAAVREGVDTLSVLTSRLIRSALPGEQARALAEAQAFDLLAQRLDGLRDVLAALAADTPPDVAVQAVTLSDMAARLAGRDPSFENPPDAGDCLLFG